MFEVTQCRLDELPPEIDIRFLPNNGSGKELASYILIKVDGNIQSVYSDASEPEDANFYSDLSWIKTELEKAYRLGLKQK